MSLFTYQTQPADESPWVEVMARLMSGETVTIGDQSGDVIGRMVGPPERVGDCGQFTVNFAPSAVEDGPS